MPTKVRVTLKVQAERIYTDEELADLYPTTALEKSDQAIRDVEHANARTDPEQYAGILMAMGGKCGLRVEVEEVEG